MPSGLGPKKTPDHSKGAKMDAHSFSGDTLDDVMRLAIKELLSSGELIEPTKGQAKEITGALIEISNPLARISRTETKGKPFSCLGELLWYLAGTNELDFISSLVIHGILVERAVLGASHA